MPIVKIDLGHTSYEVIVENGLLARCGETVRKVLPSKKLAVIADKQVFDLHGKSLLRSLGSAGFSAFDFTQAPGEKEKTLEQVRAYYEQMLKAGFDRSSAILSFGGGVVGDTAGFVAATYFRGIPFVQCPTSLLAMVDASVGGKVGVNLPQGKNLIGAFHQPRAVVIDPQVLSSLEQRELICGLAECIKHAAIQDADLFDWTLANMAKLLAKDEDVLSELVIKNVKIKAKIVEQDELEQGVRAHLNFGHTFAHAIEACGAYDKVKHGEAVAVGMLAAASLAEKLGICDSSVVSSLEEIIEKAGLPLKTKLPSDKKLLEVMLRDKKAKDGDLRLIVPEKIGAVKIISRVDEKLLSGAWDFIRL